MRSFGSLWCSTDPLVGSDLLPVGGLGGCTYRHICIYICLQMHTFICTSLGLSLYVLLVLYRGPTALCRGSLRLSRCCSSRGCNSLASSTAAEWRPLRIVLLRCSSLLPHFDAFKSPKNTELFFWFLARHQQRQPPRIRFFHQNSNK